MTAPFSPTGQACPHGGCRSGRALGSRSRRHRAIRVLAASLPLLLCAHPTSARGEPSPEIVLDHDDVVVTASTRVRPGVYRIPDANGDGVIHVKGSNVRLDLTGVVLEGAGPEVAGPDRTGIGVAVEGGRGIEIVGGAARGYRVGLRAQTVAGLTVRGFDGSDSRCDTLASTPDAEAPSDWLWPHENDAGQWETRYGAAISLVDCAAAKVIGCAGHGAQNGLLLSRCDAAEVSRNDFSFNSGWGVAMWRSSRCRVVGNACDFCVRGYSHGVYARGQDSAGFLVFEQCSDDLFASNSATHSGDGFFLYAGNETLKVTGTGGCNRNRVTHNDFSHAVANGIEATFSDENVFDENALDDCDHGVWAGYSTHTLVYGNRMRDCANGVSIEHGESNVIANNAIVRAGTAIHLWWDDDPDLLASAYGKRRRQAPSKWNRVIANQIDRAETGVRLADDHGCIVAGNGIRNARTAIHVSGSVLHPEVFSNVFARGDPALRDAVAVRSDGGARWNLGINGWSPFPQKLVGTVRMRAERPDAIVEPPDLPTVESPPALDGVAPPASPFAGLDRSAIFVDDRGPVPPGAIRILGPGPAISDAASIHVRGPGVAFEAESLDPACAVEPTAGKTPAVIHVRAAGPASGAAFLPYAVRVKVGDLEREFRGACWALDWNVRFFEWTRDPREDPAAYAALVAGAPKDEATVRSLSLRWPAAPTPKVSADHFATTAEATGTFDAGTYVLRVTSDDGIRVLVDGAVVLEDWTWHGPKDASVTVELAAGEHTIRVEHFELDGYATLRCVIEPLGEHR